MTQTIEQLTARVAELEAENAAAVLNNQQLREAFQTFIDEHEECQDADDWIAMMCSTEAHHVADEALATPISTEALDAYVAEKVKEIIESHAPEGRNVTNAQHVEMRQKFFDQIAILTRQRDLAVEALEWACGEKPNDKGKWFDAPDGAPKYWWRTELRKALSAIKESEAK